MYNFSFNLIIQRRVKWLCQIRRVVGSNTSTRLVLAFVYKKVKIKQDKLLQLYYNRSIADVQLRASSNLFELISTRDSRQLYFGNVAVTKAKMTDIINHICSS